MLHSAVLTWLKVLGKSAKGYGIEGGTLSNCPYQRRWLKVAPLLVALILASCGDSSKSTPASIVSATETLARASATLAETESIRFRLMVDGSTYIDTTEEIRLISASGELVRPDRVRAEFKIQLFAASTVSIQIITIGEKSWTTDLVSGKWGPAPSVFGYDPSILFDTRNGLGPVMGNVEEARLIGVEEIDGRPVVHIAANVSQEIVGPVTAFTMTGEPVALNFWIDQQTFALMRIQLKEPATVGKVDQATWTLDIFDFDAPMNIDAPN